MIKRVIPLVALMLSGSAIAQVGIGTKVAAKSAQLDIVSTNKGVLIPRVELVALDLTDPIKGIPDESLLVYHTGNLSLEAGFYYWKSNAWTPLLSGETLIDRMNNSFTIGTNPTNSEESLIITDTENHRVYLAVKEIANNSTFITNLVENSEFITQLGDNIEFINQITNNNEFIENIINELKGKYGNVNYNPTTNSFVYYDAQGVEHNIDWSSLNTVNFSFTLDQDHLVMTDSAGDSVRLAVSEIANNSTFITNLVENSEFITQLGDNIEFINQITNNNEFIENIINELKGKYGNVGYNTATDSFFYYDTNGQVVPISWDVLGNTKVATFEIDKANDVLVITDTDGSRFAVAIDDLGKIIANNDVFVTELVQNQEFITQLGDSIDFINQITNNNEFIENIINELRGKYGNVNYNPTTNTFVYYDEQGIEHNIDWSSLNTTNVSFTLEQDRLVVSDSAGNSVSLAVEEIANNSTFVTNLVENKEFITQLGDNIDFIEQITNNNEFIENIINELKGKYGNVNYNPTTNSFVYYDEQGIEHNIDWSSLNTVNFSFTLDQDHLVVTDSAGDSVRLAVSEIANNSTFITNLVDNNEFITQLGDNIDFIDQITNNSEFMTNIFNNLKGKYGNVGYDEVTKKFYYYDAQEVKHTINLEEEIKLYETLTTLENVVTRETDDDGQEIDVYTLTYTDEKNVAHPIDLNVLVKGNETVTTLVYDPIDHVLIYTNEKGESTNLKLRDLIDGVETLTKLEFDAATNSLLFTDESRTLHTLDLDSINQHPWYDDTTQKPATSNTANIYTKGWVGIGYTEPSGAPNERLRVNGSITAVNSYYADYVFESYFDGYSSLKYDYDFKNLDVVEDYIKENRHLPGITPIHELTKMEEGYAFNVSELSIQLLEKTEELYLHIIDQKKALGEKEEKIKELEQSNLENQKQMKEQNAALSQRIEQLEQLLFDFMQKN
ncbi:hypothetical protein [Myroides odoratus]|uniref:4-hydroxy-3-methylbut-2-enyl diphosphate reductase n=1 Tax=Myroides odoratus TaxID=256 RepID=A0A378RKC8_MYROD|nr:hypothetical protein [Myroides odoratus]STZ27496.1 4-hydroxy-3-methylbut-2-enyl diphosphate reductase [Myroides odoratus]